MVKVFRNIMYFYNHSDFKKKIPFINNIYLPEISMYSVRALQIELFVRYSSVLTFLPFCSCIHCLDPWAGFPACFIMLLFIAKLPPALCHVLIFIQERVPYRLYNNEGYSKESASFVCWFVFFSIKL